MWNICWYALAVKSTSKPWQRRVWRSLMPPCPLCSIFFYWFSLIIKFYRQLWCFTSARRPCGCQPFFFYRIFNSYSIIQASLKSKMLIIINRPGRFVFVVSETLKSRKNNLVNWVGSLFVWIILRQQIWQISNTP